MKSLNLLITCRILRNRNWTHHRLLKPSILQPSFKSDHKTGNYSTCNSSRFYCISSTNPVDAAASSQMYRAFQPAIDTAEISNLTDDELFNIITELRNSLIGKTNQDLKGFNQTEFMKIIEKECIRRTIHNWDLDKALDVLDMFYPKAKLICPNLLFRFLRTKLKPALKSETTTMMKFISAMDKNYFWKAYRINVYHVEFALIKRSDQLSLPETAALLRIVNILKGRIVSQELINALYEKLLKEIDRVDSRTLSIFLMFFSDQKTSIDFNQLIQPLLERLQDSSFVKVDGIAMFCARKKIWHPEILDNLAEQVIKRLADLTIGQLETLIKSLVYFNYNSGGIYQKLIDAFEIEPLRSSLFQHPKRLVKIISHLCLIEVYPYKYIDLILSEEFLRKTFGTKLNRYSVIREAMILNGCVKAECPNYEGNKLDDKLEEDLQSLWSSHIHHYLRTDGDTSIVVTKKSHNHINYEPTPYNQQILDTRRILSSLLGGTEYVHTCYTLPFLPRPNLLFCLDQKKNPIKLPDQILNSIRIDYKNLDKSIDWVVIMSNHQHPILKGETIIYGKEIAKERILKKLGFKLIYVTQELWRNWTEEEKKSYLNKFIC